MNPTGLIAWCPNRSIPLPRYGVSAPGAGRTTARVAFRPQRPQRPPTSEVVQKSWHLAQRRDQGYPGGPGPCSALRVAGVTLKPDGTQPSVLGCDGVDIEVVTNVDGLGRDRPQKPARMVERPGVRLPEAQGVPGGNGGKDTRQTGDLELLPCVARRGVGQQTHPDPGHAAGLHEGQGVVEETHVRKEGRSVDVLEPPADLVDP